MSHSEPVSLVDELAQKIQLQILRGDIPVGERLRQERLAELFGVSRTPIREALRKLEASGLIEVESRRGALVKPPTGREIRDAYLVRAHLEGLAADLAARWRTDAQLIRLKGAEEQFDAAVSAFVADGSPMRTRPIEEASWIAANDLFHEVVHEAAGNPCLRRTISSLHTLFPRNLTWVALSRDSRLLRTNVVQHTRVREAIERGDGRAASRLMREHITSAGDLVAKQLEQSSFAGAS